MSDCREIQISFSSVQFTVICSEEFSPNTLTCLAVNVSSSGSIVRVGIDVSAPCVGSVLVPVTVGRRQSRRRRRLDGRLRAAQAEAKSESESGLTGWPPWGRTERFPLSVGWTRGSGGCVPGCAAVWAAAVCLLAPTPNPVSTAASELSLIEVLKRRERPLPRPSSLADLMAGRSSSAARLRDFTIGGSAMDLRSVAMTRAGAAHITAAARADSSSGFVNVKTASATQARAARLAVMKKKIDRKRSYSVLKCKLQGKFMVCFHRALVVS